MTITVEQKTALTDVVGNIVSPILLWLNKFVAAKTQKERKQIVSMLSEVSKDAMRKVQNFECEDHCYPPHKIECTGILPRWKPNPNVVTERDLRRAEEAEENDT